MRTELKRVYMLYCRKGYIGKCSSTSGLSLIMAKRRNTSGRFWTNIFGRAKLKTFRGLRSDHRRHREVLDSGSSSLLSTLISSIKQTFGSWPPLERFKNFSLKLQNLFSCSFKFQHPLVTHSFAYEQLAVCVAADIEVRRRSDYFLKIMGTIAENKYSFLGRRRQRTQETL